MQQRKAAERCRELAALDPDSARTLEELRIRKSFGVRALIRRRVLADAGGERYWLDEGAWDRLQDGRRVFTLVLLGIGIVVTALVVILNQS